MPLWTFRSHCHSGCRYRSDRHLFSERLDWWPRSDAHRLEIDLYSDGHFLALVFIGFPFVVRTVQPVLADLNIEFEEAAASLGASRLQTIVRIVIPELIPPLSPASPWHLPGRLGNTGRSFSSPVICR